MIDTLYEPEIIQGIDPRSFESKEAVLSDAVVVWPNPAYNLVNIDLGSLWDDKGQYFFSIFAITGNEVLTSTFKNSQEEIDISNIPTGFYLVQIWKNGEILAVDKLFKGL